MAVSPRKPITSASPRTRPRSTSSRTTAKSQSAAGSFESPRTRSSSRTRSMTLQKAWLPSAVGATGPAQFSFLPAPEPPVAAAAPA
eukprot:12906591-Alexandrium_andersonii.AAC.1